MNGRAIPGVYLFRLYVCDNHVSANECDSGTNYHRKPRYHCICIPLYTASLVEATTCRGKGIAVSLQAWSGPEGSRKLRFPDFMTTA